MKVKKVANQVLLEVTEKKDITEKHTFTPQDRGGEQYTTATTTYGRKTWWGKYQIADTLNFYYT